MPKVSVVIPAYNVAPWIVETIRSVERQTFTDFECLIVDDASTDATCDLLAPWLEKDPRFRLIRKEKNEGQGAARNDGTAVARGEYIAFLDSDDVWHPEFLSRLLSLIAANEAWLAYSKFALFLDGSNIRKPLAWDNLLRTGNIWWDMLMTTEFHLCSWLGRADIVRAAGPFDATMRAAQDRDFLLRLLAEVCRQHPEKICGTDEELFFYRQRAGSTIHTKGRRTIELEWGFMPRYLDDPGVPASVRRRGYSFLAFKMGIISLNIKEYRKAFSWCIRALCSDPLNINLYWLPLRKVLLRFRKKEQVTFGLEKQRL